MQSIETIYLSATNSRGSRIKAKASGGESVTIPYDFALDIGDAHAKAARALCEKLNWDGELIAGSTQRGYVFVFASGERFLTLAEERKRAQIEEYTNVRVANLIGAKHVVCDGCASRDKYANVEKVPLFRVNIGHYSQACHDCAVVLVEGSQGWPMLFDAGPRSTCAYCPAAEPTETERLRSAIFGDAD